MFTKEELKKLQSCWVLPDGKLYAVAPESHDMYLPDGYYKEAWDNQQQIDNVEKKCFRMSFSWGWDAPISQMTIRCDLTESQKQIIRYLLMAKTITYSQIEYCGNNDDDFYAMLSEVDKELKKQPKIG